MSKPGWVAFQLIQGQGWRRVGNLTQSRRGRREIQTSLRPPRLCVRLLLLSPADIPQSDFPLSHRECPPSIANRRRCCESTAASAPASPPLGRDDEDKRG